jgi:hypothetical protein
MTTDKKQVIECCIELQKEAYEAIALQLEDLPSFNKKAVRLAFCDQLVCEDLDELYDKRHFNYAASQVVIRPNPDETIPLGFCLYYDKLPIGYVIGDISQEREAFEIHFTEASNFYGSSGLKGWIKYVISILIVLKEVIETSTEMKVNYIAFVNPVQDTIEPLTQIGFDFKHDYDRANNAAILKLTKVSDK